MHHSYYDLWGKPIGIKEGPPVIRRFISADSPTVLMIATVSLDCKNLFSYAENNPVMAKDSSGGVVETVFDVITIGISVVDVCCNPTDPWAWVGLAGDCIDLIPFVTGVGEGVKGLRLLAKAADKTADLADTIHDSTKVMDKVSDAAKLTKKTSGNNTRGLLSDFLGKPVNTQKGKFYSVMNESGGQVFVSTDNIVQSDISSIVSTVDGKINIISGRHGDWMDNIVLEPKFYEQDVKRFGNMKNVKVFNYGDMNPSQINNLINSGDTTILGWCYSEYSSFMRDAFR